MNFLGSPAPQPKALNPQPLLLIPDFKKRKYSCLSSFQFRIDVWKQYNPTNSYPIAYTFPESFMNVQGVVFDTSIGLKLHTDNITEQ
ncbi:hypothetical protein Agabi119p4_10251 [Agaricus bisporus var. burnettii]|uniref:Uncharacterized protein n=1 Tax=Agaricus bisporus var. burnettii TaxID=192524 RepID=A0A8H7EWF0_AGABI|nr:hypothetical protein Agabi119p4_10251 [Agaricus bisporus var. burnettii]